MVSTQVLWLLAAFATCHCATVHIYPDVESLVLTAGDQLTLSCRSSEEVTWEHKDFYKLEDVDPPLSDQYEDGTDHVSNLTIQHLSYRHVGSYLCRSTTHNSSIYIYVSDETHFLVNDEMGVIFAAPNSDVVIPCKPTQPRINVTLMSADRKKVISSVANLTPPRVTFDPQKGFTLQNVNMIDDAGFYHCKVANSSEYPSSATTEEHLTFELEILSITDLPEPEIITPIEEIMVGETLDLKCSVDFPVDAKYQSFSWSWPSMKRENQVWRVNESLTKDVLDEYIIKMTTVLMIRNVTYQDGGLYTCTLRGALQGTQTNSSQNITVLGIDQSYLELTTEKLEMLRPERFQEVKFIAEWTGSPLPKLAWFSPRGKEIPRGESEAGKYKLELNKSRIKLLVRNLEPNDAGIYQLQAHNEGHQRILNFSLLVESSPHVSMTPLSTYYMAGKSYALHCNAKGYPLPEVTWLFQRCDQYPKCVVDFVEVRRDQYMEYTRPQDFNNEVKSKYNWTAETTGVLMCRACNNVAYLNKFLCENVTTELLVTDLKEGFSMSGPEEVFEGDEVKLTCGANKYHFASNVSISYQQSGGSTAAEVVTNPKQGITVTKMTSEYSNKVELSLSPAHVNHSGSYQCEATRLDLTSQPVKLEVKTYQVKVQVLAAPKFEPGNTENGSIVSTITGRPVELKCFARGTPKPRINWYKNDHQIILDKNDTRLQLLQDNQILNIQYGALSDDGKYKCTAVNKVGVMSAYMTVSFGDKNEIKEYGNFIILLVLLAVLLIFCAILFYKIRITSKRDERNYFEEGQIEALNPEFDVYQQAELLPYDKKWEFPRAKLKLGHQLGSGAFGVVMCAQADGIVQQGETTTVAVKMVKKTNVELRYFKALRSELKIMAHLGKHLNIVNLLGACTNNMDKRELLVIVEYCKYGNLHNILLKHRDVFINQINSLGELDPSITTLKPRYVNVNIQPRLHNSTSLASGARTYESTRTTYTGLSDSSETGQIGSDGYLVPTAEKEPPWRSGYAGDRTTLKSICTQDLICWAFQVARGMEYLASRKVMHGDLAARNILLADDNIVKICDFGLAKAMFTDTNYLKTGDEPLPIKWMAIESIGDRIFSTQSDVWAYGVTLWEMFSLARTPYPGIEGVENLYLKLAEGHRMEKPEYCTDEMYFVMQDCWQAKPVMRPNFTELVERVGAMVDDNVRKHYLNLNEVYLRLNDEALGQGRDYLAMMSSPDIHNQMSAPVDPEEGDDGYLRPHDPRDDTSMELKPMLPQLESKASSFSNPSYLELTNNTHHLPETYVMPRSRMNSVDDYDPLPGSKQEATRALKLNWLFPPDLKTHTTFV